AIIPLSSDEHYDPSVQGLILSAFFWGYIWTQLGGGWMADRFGGKRVLGAGVAAWSLATLVTPPAAAISFGALFAARVMLGLGEGVNFPSIHSLRRDGCRRASGRARCRSTSAGCTSARSSPCS